MGVWLVWEWGGGFLDGGVDWGKVVFWRVVWWGVGDCGWVLWGVGEGLVWGILDFWEGW